MATREEALVAGLARVAQELRSALREVELDSRLAQVATDIPDACARLDAVLQMTEKAAHRTLDLTETARERVQAIEALAAGPATDCRAQVAAHAVALRGDLSAMAEAQSYQDLSGQIIGRVMHIVRRSEEALGELLKIAGISVDDLSTGPTAAPDGLEGPAIAGRPRPGAATQDDADAMLADLGL